MGCRCSAACGSCHRRTVWFASHPSTPFGRAAERAASVAVLVDQFDPPQAIRQLRIRGTSRIEPTGRTASMPSFSATSAPTPGWSRAAGRAAGAATPVSRTDASRVIPSGTSRAIACLIRLSSAAGSMQRCAGALPVDCLRRCFEISALPVGALPRTPTATGPTGRAVRLPEGRHRAVPVVSPMCLWQPSCADLPECPSDGRRR
jgi:hypothetical protein